MNEYNTSHLTTLDETTSLTVEELEDAVGGLTTRFQYGELSVTISGNAKGYCVFTKVPSTSNTLTVS